eukprot:g40732.t1
MLKNSVRVNSEQKNNTSSESPIYHSDGMRKKEITSSLEVMKPSAHANERTGQCSPLHSSPSKRKPTKKQLLAESAKKDSQNITKFFQQSKSKGAADASVKVPGEGCSTFVNDIPEEEDSTRASSSTSALSGELGSLPDLDKVTKTVNKDMVQKCLLTHHDMEEKT